MAKHAGGRPTKYKGGATLAKVRAAADILRNKPESFLSGYGMEQLADALGVCLDTLYEWQKVHPEFSEVIKFWVTARNAAFYKCAKALPPAIWIFMAKNILHWSDRQEVSHKGSVMLQISEDFLPKLEGAKPDEPMAEKADPGEQPGPVAGK